MADDGKRPMSISGKTEPLSGQRRNRKFYLISSILQVPPGLLTFTHPTYGRKEIFFEGLEELQRSPSLVIITGDFNCVQHLSLDRLGIRSASRTESPALDFFTDMCQLVDALDLVSHPGYDLEWEPSTHFTYWAGLAASRIDHFYVSHTWGYRVQWLEEILPPSALHISSGKRGRHRLPGKVSYPIRCANPDGTVAKLIDCLTDSRITELSNGVDLGSRRPPRPPRPPANHYYHPRLMQRRTRYIAKLRQRARRPLLTRQAWHTAQSEDQQEAHISRVVLVLQRTTDKLCAIQTSIGLGA
ncbi:unnamed protein product [Peronospora belbahrii]|uniref:Endonuclease/exonuclease/phosphatase domain-containing protein n=1 Tax=Peronospora belbahrii TaxID=622444 RepID=A0ABN8D0A6_9STRA|nr:unnamed protein product [Peronospora belbahrii]